MVRNENEGVSLEYNELKKGVLEGLRNRRWHVSESIFLQVRNSNYKSSLNALRMALLRYYRQGIVERRRRSGAYEYRISDRGLERLAWLTKTTKNLGVSK